LTGAAGYATGGTTIFNREPCCVEIDEELVFDAYTDYLGVDPVYDTTFANLDDGPIFDEELFIDPIVDATPDSDPAAVTVLNLATSVCVVRDQEPDDLADGPVFDANPTASKLDPCSTHTSTTVVTRTLPPVSTLSTTPSSTRSTNMRRRSSSPTSMSSSAPTLPPLPPSSTRLPHVRRNSRYSPSTPQLGAASTWRPRRLWCCTRSAGCSINTAQALAIMLVLFKGTMVGCSLQIPSGSYMFVASSLHP
jgi:hypothetical protein